LLKGKKTAALYARVSTRDQEPENQLIELRKYAERFDLEVYEEYIDKISGAKENRPGLDRLLQDARQRRFNFVIVWKIDRLGRSVSHMVQVIQELQHLHIDLVITTLGVDTQSPVGKLVLGVLMQIAEFERELIRERVLLGLKRAKRQGRRLGRPAGSKDKKPRRKSGYVNRWIKEKGKDG